MRYEVRMYDRGGQVEVTVSLSAADRHAAEFAARAYLLELSAHRNGLGALELGAVIESPE